jgi:hypothetical protein
MLRRPRHIRRRRPLLRPEVERAEGPLSSRLAEKVRAEGAELRKEEGACVEPMYDILLGATQPSPQFGLLGARPDRHRGQAFVAR